MFWAIQQIPAARLIAQEIEPLREIAFVPALSVYQVYHDNIFFLEEDRIDDFITMVSPSAVLTYESPKTKVSASYMGGYELFYEYPELNTTENQNASLNLSLQPTRRISLDVTDSMAFYSGTLNRGYGSAGGGIGYFGSYGVYRREQNLMLPPEDRTRNYIEMLGPPVDYWGNSVDATLSYRLSETSRTQVRYFNRFFKYLERGINRFAAEDSWEQGGQGGINYQHTIRDTFSLDYMYRRFSYSRETDTNVRSIITGWEHKFSPTLSFRLSGGPIFISAVREQPGNEESEVSWEGAASVTKSFRRGGISLGYWRDIEPYGGLGGTGISQRVSLEVNSGLTERLDMGFAASYSTSRPAVEGRSFYYQDLEYYSTGVDISYMLTDRLRAISSYYYTHQTLEQTGGDFDYHQATSGLEYAFSRWLSGNLLYTYSNFSFPLVDVGNMDIYANMIMLGFSATWRQ